MSTLRTTVAAGLVSLAAFGTVGAHAAGPSTIPSDDEIFATIEELVAFSPRRVGTPGVERTVEYIGRKFESYGLSHVHVEEAPTYSWAALEHDLSFAGERVDASPVIYSQSPARNAVGEHSTPPGGLVAPIADVGLATAAEVAAADVRGKIVLFDLKFLLPVAGLLPVTEFLWDPDGSMTLSPPTLLTANPYITTFTEAVKAAQDAGAAGFIGVLSDYFDSNKYYNEFYRRQLVQIPGMWITSAEGARLREQLAAKPAEQGRMVLRTRREKVPSHVVVGFLEGKSTDAIQIQSHHDSGFEGAVEDASGVAEVLALARHYARQPPQSREKTLMFTTFDSHWSGYDAHHAFLKRHVVERNPQRDPHRIVANVTLEHIAKHALRGPGGRLEVSELPEPRGIFENLAPALKAAVISAVVRNDLRRTAVLNGSPMQPVGIPTDASGAVMLGIPTASLIAGPMYLYDAADTVDKVLRHELNKVAVAFSEIVDAIDATPVSGLGLLPAPLAEQLGRQFLGSTSAIPDSVDRPLAARATGGCVAARSGRAVSRARITRSRRGLRLGFRARRTVAIRATAQLAGSRRRALRAPRRITACRSYSVRLPRGTRRARISWNGGSVTLRAPRSR